MAGLVPAIHALLLLEDVDAGNRRAMHAVLSDGYGRA